jgi:type II secretory pathway pseudopilin PulG
LFKTDGDAFIGIAILGIPAAAFIPNVSGFIISEKVFAANFELAAMNTAAEAYISETSATSAFTQSN